MSYIDRTLPPGDRNDAPELPMEAAPLAPANPPLTDDTEAARLRRLTRHLAEANKWAMEALIALSEGKRLSYRAHMLRCNELLEATRPLSALLAVPPKSRASKE